MQHTLKFSHPAACWEAALPLGNGSFGAMVFGGENGIVKFNHDTLWSGCCGYSIPKNRREELKQLRKLIFDRKYDEAHDYAFGLSAEDGVGRYLPLGDLRLSKIQKCFVNYTNTKSEYEFALNLLNAEASERFADEKRTMFISYPHNVFVMKIESCLPVSYCISAFCPLEHTYFRSDEYIGFGGKASAYRMEQKAPDGIPISSCGENTIAFSFAADVQTDGKCIIKDNEITVYDATEIILCAAAETNFSSFDREPDISKNTLQPCLERIAAAFKDGFDKVETEHINDYRKLYDRVKLELDGSFDEYTDIRRKNFINGGEDSGLFELMFNFGRYLLISSSREGTQAANLQGIWNELITPPWSCDYTVNINTQMNYWPAEVCNLSECHEPLFKMIEEACRTGERTAETMYGCGGSCAHHNIDLWRNTNIAAGNPMWALWPMSEIWLTCHLWQHYEYTFDRDFLENTVYPITKKSVEFIKDFLVTDNDGFLVTCPSTSPENVFRFNGKNCCVSKMSTMDNSIIRELFANYEKICEILGKDCDIEIIKNKLPPIRPSGDGRIPEWCEEFEECDKGHRHVSHLFGIFPGSCLRGDSALEAAAEKSINVRLANGGGATGWSKAWIINLYVQLKNGEKAYEQAARLIKNSTYINLLDKHPPFQIDGNLGFTSAMAYMFVQSHEENGIYYIELLPAIPEKWEKGGSVSGLAAKGGFVVDFKWKNGEISDINIQNKYSNKYEIVYR